MQRATKEEPLAGCPYGLWNEPGLPNWVGHLVTNRLPEHQLLVYDHAIGGVLVGGVGVQIQYTFVRTIAPRPDWAAWTPIDSLFGTPHEFAHGATDPFSPPDSHLGRDK